ncbi:MAG: O-antigen ligase family protein [Bacteroidota bacterium]
MASSRKSAGAVGKGLASKSLLNVLFVASVILLSIPIVYLIANSRIFMAIGILAGLIGIAVGFICFINVELGFLVCFVFCSSIFLMSRLAGTDLPYGAARDAILLILFVGILVQRIKKKAKVDWSLNNPVTIVLIIYTTYLLIQFFNPSGTIDGWLFGIRGYLSYLIAYFIILNLFKDYKYFIRFTKLWMAVALLGALYAFYQEIMGLPGFDLRWVTATEARIGLNFIQGKWRKWSFFSDSASFGLIMAFSSVYFIVLALGPFSFRKRAFLMACGLLILVAMTFSGTRTAYAIVPAGFVLYVMLTINSKRTLIISAVMAGLLVVVIFGPFQGKTINRVRSAFRPQEEASMEVRDINRARIQPYIHSHPIGGGLVTAGEPGKRFSPNHPLAGFPPDSFYLESALEQGWIGLFLHLAIYFTVLATSIKNFYKTKNEKIRYFYLAQIAAFFSLTIGAYAKTNIAQLPTGLILMAVYAAADKLVSYEKQIEEEETEPTTEKQLDLFESN